jgi:hypothetical protein
VPAQSGDAARRGVTVDDAFARRLAQISHGNAELGFGRCPVPLRNHFSQLADFGSDARLHASIADATL